MNNDALSEPANIELSAALGHIAMAARAWSERRKNSSNLVHGLMRGASWANRVRAAERQEPLTLDGFVQALEQPLDEWLDSTSSGQLLEGGVPTLLCGELLEDAANPESEAEQRAMVHVMQTFAGRADGARHYTKFRKFIIDHPWASEREILDLATGARLHPDQVYERIGSECVITRHGAELFAPCPVCGWPMREWDGQVCCVSDQCRTRGARFVCVSGSELRALGSLAAPELVARDGHRRLRHGLWRYTVLPGLVELQLCASLKRLAGVSVELWPNLDRYDLDVRYEEHHWMVDVKDHASLYRLVRRLREQPPNFPLYIVVPDHREQQVPALRQLFREIKQYSFYTCEGFVREVARKGL
jgi:hypothetical protein